MPVSAWLILSFSLPETKSFTILTWFMTKAETKKAMIITWYESKVYYRLLVIWRTPNAILTFHTVRLVMLCYKCLHARVSVWLAGIHNGESTLFRMLPENAGWSMVLGPRMIAAIITTAFVTISVVISVIFRFGDEDSCWRKHRYPERTACANDVLKITQNHTIPMKYAERELRWSN